MKPYGKRILVVLALLVLALLGHQLCTRLFSSTDPTTGREQQQVREMVRQLQDLNRELAQPPKTISINQTALIIPPPSGSIATDIASPLPEYAIKASFLVVDREKGEAAGYSVSEIVDAADAVAPEHFQQFRHTLKRSLGTVELPQSGENGDNTLAMTLTPGQPVILLEDEERVVTTALRSRGMPGEDPAHTTSLESFILLDGTVVRLTLALSGRERQSVEKGLALLREWRAGILAANQR